MGLNIFPCVAIAHVTFYIFLKIKNKRILKRYNWLCAVAKEKNYSDTCWNVNVWETTGKEDFIQDGGNMTIAIRRQSRLKSEYHQGSWGFTVNQQNDWAVGVK